MITCPSVAQLVNQALKEANFTRWNVVYAVRLTYTPEMPGVAGWVKPSPQKGKRYVFINLAAALFAHWHHDPEYQAAIAFDVLVHETTHCLSRYLAHELGPEYWRKPDGSLFATIEKLVYAALKPKREIITAKLQNCIERLGKRLQQTKR